MYTQVTSKFPKPDAGSLATEENGDITDEMVEALFPRTGVTFWPLFAEMEFIVFGILLFVSIQFFNWQIFPYLVLAALVTPVCLFSTLVRWIILHKKSGTVVQEGRTIRIRHPALFGPPQYYSADLADCRWFRGSRAWVTVPWNEDYLGPWWGGDSLLIELPDDCRTPVRMTKNKKGESQRYEAGPVIVAVGFRSETRLRWEDVLFRLNVRHDEDREASPPPMSEGFADFWTILSIPVTILLAVLLGKGVYDGLCRLNVPGDIAFGFWYALVTTGSVLPIFLVHALIFLYRHGQTVKRGVSSVITRTRDLYLLLVAGLFLSNLLLWTALENHEGTQRSAWIAGTVALCGGIAAGLGFYAFSTTPARQEGLEHLTLGDFSHLPADDFSHYVDEEITTARDLKRYEGHFNADDH